MNRVALLVVILCGMAAASPATRAQKDKAGLIVAWEQAQKADPETTKFEKTAEGQYNFATKRFPFDGALLVRNVSIEDVPVTLSKSNYATGTVEVELQSLPPNFREVYAINYERWWTATNTLYWSAKANRWLTSAQYFRDVRENLPYSTGLWPFMSIFGWSAILVLVFGVVVFNAWRVNRRVAAMNKRNERVVQISERNAVMAEQNAMLFEENTKIFREILDELKKLNAPHT